MNNPWEVMSVMAWQRRAGTVAAVLIALAAQGSPRTLSAQQTIAKGQTPGPRFMVPVLRGSERGLGAQVADALRERMMGEFMMRTLWIIPKSDIDNALEQSGYSKTDPLNQNDARQLAILIRADEYVEGTVTKTDAGTYDFTGSMLLIRPDGMVQPLPKVSGAKLGDIVKGISNVIEQARKPVDDVKKCVTDWRQNKYAEALNDAEKGLKDYPNSTMARVCMLEVYNSKKLGPDSIIKVSKEILAIDSKNRRALSLVADAYSAKKMDDEYIQALANLLSADPTNARLTETVVNEIARVGKPEIAKPIIDEAVKQNPGDPALIRLQWRIYLALKLFKDAPPIGEEMVRTDTAAADTTFFTRIVAAYGSDSNFQKASEWAARGTAKFPSNVNLWMMLAQVARSAGQAPQALEAVNHALQLNPKEPLGNLQKATILVELNQTDSMVTVLQAALAAGDDKSQVAGVATSVANKLRISYGTSKNDDEAKRALELLQFVDKTAPTPTSYFLMAVVNFALGANTLQAANPAKSCDMTKAAGAYFTEAFINLPKGASAFPDQVKAVSDGLTQMNGYQEQMVKAFCK